MHNSMQYTVLLSRFRFGCTKESAKLRPLVKRSFRLLIILKANPRFSTHCLAFNYFEQCKESFRSPPPKVHRQGAAGCDELGLLQLSGLRRKHRTMCRGCSPGHREVRRGRRQHQAGDRYYRAYTHARTHAPLLCRYEGV